MENLKFILALLFIGACAYSRYKFDKNYTIPVLEELKEDQNFSTLKSVCIILFVVAIICMALQLQKIGFILLIILIPLAMYLNSKVYGQAWKKSKNKD